MTHIISEVIKHGVGYHCSTIKFECVVFWAVFKTRAKLTPMISLSPPLENCKSDPGVMISTKQLEIVVAILGGAGALLLAMNINASPFGWVPLTLSAMVGIPWARRLKLPFMMAMQVLFLVIDSIGVYRNVLPILS